MELFGSYTSPFVRHCRVALAQSGTEYEFIVADYTVSARKSPNARVPFLVDGDLMLTDSSAILKYIREKSGQTFLADIMEFDTYFMVGTALDSTVNLFLLENDGYGPDQIPYLTRQKNRVESILKELNERIDPSRGISTDSALRCACFVDWALFRKRINIEGLDNLKALLDAANSEDVFSSTSPTLSG